MYESTQSQPVQYPQPYPPFQPVGAQPVWPTPPPKSNTLKWVLGIGVTVALLVIAVALLIGTAVGHIPVIGQQPQLIGYNDPAKLSADLLTNYRDVASKDSQFDGMTIESVKCLHATGQQFTCTLTASTDGESQSTVQVVLVALDGSDWEFDK